MTPWYIATRPFSAQQGDAWTRFIRWSGLDAIFRAAES
jgi:hypothetical protein